MNSHNKSVTEIQNNDKEPITVYDFSFTIWIWRQDHTSFYRHHWKLLTASVFHVTVLGYLYIYSLSYILVLGLWIMKLAMLNGWRLNIGCRIWRFLSAHRDSRARLGHTGVRLDTVRTSSTDMLIDEEVRSGCRCNRSTFSGECKATPAVRGR